MFKDKLKELREKNNISQYQLADKIFVSRSAIAKWENGLGMPSSDSVDMLCKFFNVSKEELLNDDDPNVIIKNVGKRSKRIITILIIILCAFVIFSCANAIATFVQIKEEEEYKISYNAFYSEKYLSEMSLKGLEMISSDDYLMIGKNAFKAKVESYDIYDKYVNYIYNKLSYSTSISYLSCGYDITRYDVSNSTHTSAIYSENYLVPTQNINDHIIEISDNMPTMYVFYYISSLDENRISKDPINVNRILLEYNKENPLHQLEMYIDQIISNDEEQISSNSYLANEYFNIEKVKINKDNYLEYFDVIYGFDSVRLQIKQEYCLKDYLKVGYNYNPFYKLFIELAFNITYINSSGKEINYKIHEKHINMMSETMDFYRGDLGLSYYDNVTFNCDFNFMDESILYILTPIQ